MIPIRRSGPLGPRPPRSPAAAWAVVVASACGLSSMPRPAPADDAPKATALFDGKTLDGWAKTKFSGAGDVTVEDGAIVLNAGRPMTGITSTRKDLPTVDYELTYEARRLSGPDFFAAATFPVKGSHVTLVNGGWGGNVTGLSSINGADASENETTTPFTYEAKRWYRFRVRVTDRVIRAWIDDKSVIDVDLDGRQVGTRVEVHANQPLGFAAWDTAGAIRKVEVRKLSAAEVKATNPIER